MSVERVGASVRVKSDSPDCLTIGSYGCIVRTEDYDARGTSWYVAGSAMADTTVSTQWLGPMVMLRTPSPSVSSSAQYSAAFSVVWRSFFPGSGARWMVGRAVVDVSLVLGGLLADPLLVSAGASRIAICSTSGDALAVSGVSASHLVYINSDGAPTFKKIWEVNRLPRVFTRFRYLVKSGIGPRAFPSSSFLQVSSGQMRSRVT